MVALSKKKGDRNERKAKKILQCYKGVRAEKVLQKSGYNVDLFGLADLLGINPDTGELYLVQVKTNGGFTEEKMRHFAQMATIRLHDELHHFEVWDRADRQGWTFYRFNPDMEQDDPGYFHHEDWGGMEKYAEVNQLNDPKGIAEELLEQRPEDFSSKNWAQEEHERKSAVKTETTEDGKK